jgi:6-phosphogluconate dehydrogenase
MRAAADEYKWKLNYGDIALMWRGGCHHPRKIPRDIRRHSTRIPPSRTCSLDPFFMKAIADAQDSWRKVVATAVRYGVPVPAFSSALAYYDSYRTANLPANMLQAQRDYFGAHTYERVDKPRGQFFHTEWTAYSGKTTSSTYNA